MTPLPGQHDLMLPRNAEPTRLAPDVVWAYNQLTFETIREMHRVQCTIAPGYGEVAIRIWNRDVQVVGIDVADVRGLRVEREQARDALVLTFAESTRLGELVLSLQPTGCVTWSFATA